MEPDHGVLLSDEPAIAHSNAVVLPMHSSPSNTGSVSVTLDEEKTNQSIVHYNASQLVWKKKKSLDIENGSSSWESVAGLRQAQFAIQGMTCGACTSAIKSAVEPLDGVISVDAHFISNQAIVVYQPTVVDHTRIGDAIEDSGYGATLWEDVKLEPEAQRQADIRTIEIEFRGYNRLGVSFVICKIQY